jgi:lauroyl/myristoyl acyltransferase
LYTIPVVHKLGYYLYSAAKKLSGERAAEAFIERILSASVNAPATRNAVKGNLRRIISYSRGAAPTEGELDAAVAEMARIYGRYHIDLAVVQSDPEKALALAEAKFLKPVQSLLAEGRGAILATAHFGDENILALNLALRGIPVSVIVVYSANTRWVSRLVPNLRYLDVGRSAIDCMNALKRNEVVLTYGEVDYFPGGRTMDFFGAPFHPPHGVARLALASGAPILPVYGVWKDKRLELRNREPLRPDKGVTQEDLERGILDSMEAFIGEHPTHWFAFEDAWDLAARDRHYRRQLRFLWGLHGLRRLMDNLAKWARLR